MADPDRNAFQSALSDFVFEAACGGAIRHLADNGCTVKQIMERLDYPISGERVRSAYYKYFCDSGVILETSPEEGRPQAKPEYVLEYDSYGKPSDRRKNPAETGGNMPDSGMTEAVWREEIYRPEEGSRLQGPKGMPKEKSGQAHCSWGRGAELSVFLAKMCSRKGNGQAYLSCDFGIPDSRAAKGVSLLNGRQQEYLEGIPWPRRRVYHRLDQRMKEILCSLYEQGAYEGICYFPSSRVRLLVR